MNEGKLDLILAELIDLRKQVTLVQAAMLEVARGAGAERGRDIGRKVSGQVDECVMSGCEDQCSACQE